MPLPSPTLPWAHDLPVCFPGRPCMDFPPLSADVVNATAALSPWSGAITIGCIVVLGIGLALVVLGLRPRPTRPGPPPWLVVLSVALLLLGWAATSAADGLFGTISLIYGAEPGPIADLIGSWPQVRLAGDALTFVGVTTLVVTASVATVRLRSRSTA